MDKKQVAVIIGVFSLAVLLRLFCLPTTAYFCDVPLNQMAVATGKMIIQFPGYAPYHQVIKMMAWCIGSVFGSMVLFSLICGLVAMLLCVLLAHERSGFPGALLVATVMGFSILPVYFSCVGASYATDMLAAAGMIYFGGRFLQLEHPCDYYLALVWFMFGCIMRPLSCGFTGLAILYLLFRKPSLTRTMLTCAFLTAGVVLFMIVSLPYYGSVYAFLVDGKSILFQLRNFNTIQVFFNLFRVAIYPLWGLHAFLIMTVLMVWRSRKTLDLNFGLFLMLLICPYFCLILCYIPHAGYYCLMLPVFVSFPWISGKPVCRDAPAIFISATLAFVLLCQMLMVRPITTTGPVSLVSNVYMFQYSYSGIKEGRFETLSSLSYKSGILKDAIPANRIKDVMILRQ